MTVEADAPAATAVKPPAQAQVLTGAQAVAHAMCQLAPEVVPVYPITPQTPIIETFAQLVADGLADSEIINVESEHSAMSAAVGASICGARVMTATSSQGLALMLEVVYIASSMRCPIGIGIGNRALSGPINIHCDHSDSMMARDAGAIQIFCENAQEAYDYTLIGQRLAEHPDVLLPVMVMQDGFTITHSAEVVCLLEDEAVKGFAGEYRPRHPLLEVSRPTTQGPFDMPDYYFEHKAQQVEAMQRAYELFPEVQRRFSALSGRDYEGYYEGYRLEDARYVLVVLGSTAGTAQVAVDAQRRAGQKAGLLKPRLFRPFPRRELAEALGGAEAVAVLDRSLSFGSRGPLYTELAAALYGLPPGRRPRLFSYTYGLGGRDIRAEQLTQVLAQIQDPDLGDEPRYVGLRGR